MVSEEITAQEVVAQSGLWREKWNALRPRARHGLKMIVAFNSYQEERYGTAAYRQETKKHRREVFAKVKAEHPEWCLMAVYEEAGKRCKCSEKTIRRAFKDPLN